MRKCANTYLVIYEEGVSHKWLCNCSIPKFLIYEENFLFFFISVFSTKINAVRLWMLTCMWTTWLYRLSLISMSSRPSLVRIFSQASRSMKAEASIVPRSAIIRTFCTQHTNHVFPPEWVKYEVRTPIFFWAPFYCAQRYHLAATPQPPPPPPPNSKPPHLGLIRGRYCDPLPSPTVGMAYWSGLRNLNRSRWSV